MHVRVVGKVAIEVRKKSIEAGYCARYHRRIYR